MYLIDTNVVSELRKAYSSKANPNVIHWFASANAELFYLSPITIKEIERGVLMMERRDPKRGQVLRVWLTTQILKEFAGRVVPIDEIVAKRCAQLHALASRPEGDAWIAATALVHGMTVVTRNVADFEPTGVSLLNPWDKQPA